MRPTILIDTREQTPLRFSTDVDIEQVTLETIRDDDEGAWSRVRRIPFTNPLPKERQDPNMRENLRGWVVQAAVLRWAVKGCLEWQKSGIGTCEAVEKSSAEYRSEMDRVAAFFAEHCKFAKPERIARAGLRDAYEAWCKEQGIKHPLSGQDFAARLKERGVGPGKSKGVRYWNGVRLLRDDEEPEGGDVGAAGATTPEKFLTREKVEKVPVRSDPRVPPPPVLDEEREAIQAEGGGE